MAVTFIDYKNKDYGFWITEKVMELASQYIYQELTTNEYHFKDIEELTDDAKGVLSGYFRSYLSFSWEEDLKDEEDEKEMIRLFENILEKMKSKGTYISMEELFGFPIISEYWENEWRKPFKTQNMIKIFSALVAIFKGEWTSTNYSMNREMDWL
ncbi:hypothetical protein NBRC110019_24270 [Neptunitalea chrysea]|uniref:Uncharacterized protein n=1 Tax=Neptunitalea chrysea TaxID=1647581 RepID=A0A9W6B5V8_9FLAO|nr:hypothetical protein [Neptunitalea chrysea]GLB53386.1 hypothetical protein NBRC110019_24270 [Neptunitalea chrysea]